MSSCSEGEYSVAAPELKQEKVNNGNKATDTCEVSEEVVDWTLPPRLNIPRGTPLSTEVWEGFQDTHGRVTEVNDVKQLIFRGGVAHSIRHSVWKYLLDYHPWHMTHAEIQTLQQERTEEYFSMKLQWRSMTKGQEKRSSIYSDRKSLVKKDLHRTDNEHPFFAGVNNPNLVVVQDIFLTYIMYNSDLGYKQGMNDILAPLLLVLTDEVDSFWCFVKFMESIEPNFHMVDTKPNSTIQQMKQLYQLLAFCNPSLAHHLAQNDSADMHFVYEILQLLFKRMFSYEDIMRVWEVLWTGLPCANFHLLICVAILDAESEIIINKNLDHDEILMYVRNLSMCLDVDQILSTAEGIYHQIISAQHLTDQIRIILGISRSTNSKEATSQVNGTEDGLGFVSPGTDEVLGFVSPGMDEVEHGLGIVSPKTDKVEHDLRIVSLGTDEVEHGLGIISPGTDEVEHGLGIVSPGTDEVEDGLRIVSPGTDEVEDGPGFVSLGVDEVEDGLGIVSPGTDKVEDGLRYVSPGMDEVEHALGIISPGTNEVEHGLGIVSPGTDEVEDGLRIVSPRTDEVQDSLGIGSPRMDKVIYVEHQYTRKT